MTHDEPREPAEGLASANRGDGMTPEDVLNQYAEKAFEATEGADDSSQLRWSDPRAARFRRAVAAEANKKGNAKRRAREAEAKVQALQQDLDSAHVLFEQMRAEHKALEEKFREVWVELQFTKSKEADAADSQSAGVALD